MNSGGNFYLLLPDLPETLTALSDIQKAIDEWMIANLNGELALNLAWQAFGDEGFEGNFGTVVHEVKERLNLKKQNKFSSYFQKSGSWENSDFTLPVSFHGQPVCPQCKKYPLPDGKESCARCSLDGKIGRDLPKASCISFYKDKFPDRLNIFGYTVELSALPPKFGEPYLVEKLNNPDLLEISSYPAGFKYLATHVAREKENILTFEDIAKKSNGQRLLGFLKADVDNLGRLVIFGLKRDNKSLDTISRQTTFSRLMETFFTGYLESLVSDKYPDCYTVFSGGDDLFYVGPWVQILDLAEQINKDFHEFTCNQKLTLSAGISITKPGYPIARAADLVEEALKISKNTGKNPDGTEGRNRITILDTTLTWQEWNAVKTEWYDLQNLLDIKAGEGDKVASSFLYHLLKLAGMWQEYIKEGKTSGLRFYPLLAYNIKRNLDERRMPDLYKWAQRLLAWPPGEVEKRLLDHLGLIVTLCLFNARGGKKE